MPYLPSSVSCCYRDSRSRATRTSSAGCRRSGQATLLAGGVHHRARATRPKASEELRLFPFRPLLIDAYVVNSFLFYFGVLLTSLLALIEVFTFFELLGDMVKNDIEMSTMLDYLFHLAPKLIYDVTPIGILVSSLICFGILTKHNEVTAFKAGGVSLYRLAAPVLVVSLAISGTLFAFDHYYIPEANRRQERLRAEIKKKPVATYLRSDRQWVYGQGSRIYNFHFLDPKERSDVAGQRIRAQSE